MPQTSGTGFVASGAAVGMGVSATIGNVGLVGSFGGIGLGMAPMTAAGIFTGAAIYGAKTAISQGDAMAWGAIGLGSVAGMGLSSTIGGVGLGFGGTAIGLGMGSMAAMGGIFGLGIYGLAQLLNSSSSPEPFEQLYTRMEEKISAQEFYTEALLELSLASLERSFAEGVLKQKFDLLEVENELEQLKKSVSSKGQAKQETKAFKKTIHPPSEQQNFQKREADDELEELKRSVFSGNQAKPEKQPLNTRINSPKNSMQWRYQKSLKVIQKNVCSLAISPDGKYLISGGGNGTIELWDLLSGKRLFTFIQGTQEITTLAVTSGGSSFVSGSYDQTINLWKIAQKSFEKTFLYLNNSTSHSGLVLAVCCHPHKNIVLSGDSQNMIRVWELKTGRYIRNLPGHSGLILALAISPDGKFLASGSSDHSIVIWDLSNYQIIHKITSHSGWVKGLAFTPDSQKLISGSADGTCRIWDLATGNGLQTIVAHDSGVMALSLHPNGKLLATVGKEKGVKIWDLETGELLQVIEGQFPLMFSPDGAFLVTGEAKAKLSVYQCMGGGTGAFSNDAFPIHSNQWWEVLGVHSNADLQTVKQAYRQLARRYHPDVNSSPEAIAAMQAVNRAYENFLSL